MTNVQDSKDISLEEKGPFCHHDETKVDASTEADLVRQFDPAFVKKTLRKVGISCLMQWVFTEDSLICSCCLF